MEHTCEIGVHSHLPILRAQIRDRSKHPDSGVVDQNVQAAQCIVRIGEKLSYLLKICYIAGHAYDFCLSLSPHLLGEIFYRFAEGIFIAATDSHIHTAIQ